MALRLASIAVYLATAMASCGEDETCQFEMATRFAPVLRLDKTTVDELRCLPGHPEYTYNIRKTGNTDVICESDITKLERGEVPIFYRYEECAEGVVILIYYIWYSHQPACLDINVANIVEQDFGAHKADWERIAVHIRMNQVVKVRFHQHRGSYTKARQNMEFDGNSQHTVIYVGQDSHGSYHNAGGTGNCLYFQDFRRFEDPRLKLEGWHFLIDIKNKSTNLPEWFWGDRQYYDGYPSPGELVHKDQGCNDNSCRGVDKYNYLTGICTGVICGCRRSDWCDDVPFGSTMEEKPCDTSRMDDLQDQAKDFIGSLFDRNSDTASISGTVNFRRFAGALLIGCLQLSLGVVC